MVMPRTKEGGYIIDDSSVVLKKNPYIEPPEEKEKEELKEKD